MLEADRLVSYVGIVVRDATLDGEEGRIGGVGGIKTHPEARGRGHAAAGMEAALTFMAAKDCRFGLLVCDDELVPYYEPRGWKLFGGTLWTIQPAPSEVFTFNKVMVKNVAGPAPSRGSLDLEGPPW